MSGNRGMLSLSDLTERVSVGDIDTVIIAFSDHYGRLLGMALVIGWTAGRKSRAKSREAVPEQVY